MSANRLPRMSTLESHRAEWNEGPAGELRPEKVRWRLCHALVELPQRRDVIQYPKRPTMSSDDHIVMMNDQIADRRGGHVETQGQPIVAVIQREVDGALGAANQEL